MWLGVNLLETNKLRLIVIITILQEFFKGRNFGWGHYHAILYTQQYR